jgi:tetratricopeptide (TPR) repeat protein
VFAQSYRGLDAGAARLFSRRALLLHRRLGNDAGEANASDRIGYAYVRLGRHQEAISHYERALRLFRAVGSRLDEAEVLDHLGDARAAAGAPDAARTAWSEALAILEPLGYAGAATVRSKLTGTAISG